ncbi:protein phosphatase 2C domain-containing protein [Streptomyces sp. NPDC058739]|uniref:protein phosphatase 2C domain-containing protein n=1 Tax=Streptomyces sp. NPDC058739 TaxID=3346618 RepID=UPI0036B9D786
MIVAGASVAGAAHRDAGRGGEDAFRAVRTGHGAVLAVADGVGSRPRAALGAHLAVDTACRVLAAVPPPGRDAGAPEWTAWTAERGAFLAGRCSRWARALTGNEDGEPDDLAAALLVAFLRPPWVAFVSLGDCFAAVLTRANGRDGGSGSDDRGGSRSPDATDTPDGTDSPESLTAPTVPNDSDREDNSDRKDVPGRTATPVERCHLVLPPPEPGGPPPAYTTSPSARLRVRTFTVWEPELSGVVLATDGCAPLALDHPSVRGLPDAAGPLPSPRFLPPLAAALRRGGGSAEPLHAVLSGTAAAERTGDDLTLLCALTEGDGRWG